MLRNFDPPCIEILELKGNTQFPSAVLGKWFGLNRRRISIGDLNAKTQLITKLYKNHGYELARTEKRLTTRGLELIIEEGRLNEVRFTGNKRIKQHELAHSLRLQAGDVYNSLKTETQIARMREELAKHNAIFKDVRDWQARREARSNVLIIAVEEHSPVRYYAVPRVGFKSCTRINFWRQRCDFHGRICQGTILRRCEPRTIQFNCEFSGRRGNIVV